MTYGGWDSPARRTDTDHEEHGAVGDVSTGRRFKVVQNVPTKLRIDEGATYTYIGKAQWGTPTSSALWRIIRITNASGDMDAADGDDLFNNIWDNRASLSYS